jgi:ribosomal protein L7/L12
MVFNINKTEKQLNNYFDMDDLSQALETISADAASAFAPRPEPKTVMVSTFPDVFKALVEQFPNRVVLHRFLEYMVRTLPGNKVVAIKLIRGLTGIGLKEAKAFVDYIVNELSPRNPNKEVDCTGKYDILNPW